MESHSQVSQRFRFSFTQPNRKTWGARLVDVIKHQPHKLFFCDTITRRVAKQG